MKTKLGIGLGLIVVAIIIAVMMAVQPLPQSPPHRLSPSPSPKQSSIPKKPGRKNVAAQSKFYVKPEIVPVELEGFYQWKQGKRLSEVSRLMRDRRLPKAYLDFFRAELFNRTHWAVTRNNMANALVYQEASDPELYRVFIKMLEDEEETVIWRDYCLQFLSELLEHSSEPEHVKEVIRKFAAHGKGDSVGTATIAMARHEQSGGMQLDEDFGERLMAQLEDPEVSRAAKLSILAVIGERRDVRRLPVVRRYAAQDDDAGLKRTAIGTLGLMGDDRDLSLVEKALRHKNRGVVLAASAALKRLKAPKPQVRE